MSSTLEFGYDYEGKKREIIIHIWYNLSFDSARFLCRKTILPSPGKYVFVVQKSLHVEC
jgi:hypothetical protein